MMGSGRSKQQHGHLHDSRHTELTEKYIYICIYIIIFCLFFSPSTIIGIPVSKWDFSSSCH